MPHIMHSPDNCANGIYHPVKAGDSFAASLGSYFDASAALSLAYTLQPVSAGCTDKAYALIRDCDKWRVATTASKTAVNWMDVLRIFA